MKPDFETGGARLKGEGDIEIAKEAAKQAAASKSNDRGLHEVLEDIYTDCQNDPDLEIEVQLPSPTLAKKLLVDLGHYVRQSAESDEEKIKRLFASGMMEEYHQIQQQEELGK